MKIRNFVASLVVLILTALNANAIDLMEYGPCFDDTVVWYKSLSPNTTAAGVRYSTHINDFDAGGGEIQTWCRWHFSSDPSTDFDIMYWAQDDTLRYSATYASWAVTYYPNSVAYAPRYLEPKGAVEGGGITDVEVDLGVDGNIDCWGTNTYTYHAKDLGPMIWVKSRQAVDFTLGPCGDMSWEEDHFLIEVNGVKAWGLTWGGPEPFSWSNTWTWGAVVDRVE